MTAKHAYPHDVIQLDPEHTDWGPLLCVVEETSSTGVLCYAFHPEERGTPPGLMYLRPRHGHYKIVGTAAWIAANAAEVADEPG